MKPSDYPPAIRAVFDTFSRDSGIPLRLVSCIQAEQATVFSDHFELWELTVVIRWILSRVRAAEDGTERTGMSRLSLQWHCIFGNNGDMALAPFQQKLGLATAWAQKQARHLLPAPEKPAQTAPQKPEKPAETAPVWDAGRAKFEEMQKQLSGPTFTRGDAADDG
jgi:hypothetical protein